MVADDETRSLLVPSEVYVLVKRFTSKEERRRVVACIYDPQRVAAEVVAFENHLNYYHVCGHGLSMTLAKGLAAYLNSTLVDVYFRQFNGHTQVNATDLRSLRYPPRSQLERLGQSLDDPAAGQEAIDGLLPLISWESEVWVAEDADHIIHFNGERFRGPYPDATPPALGAARGRG